MATPVRAPSLLTQPCDTAAEFKKDEELLERARLRVLMLYRPAVQDFPPEEKKNEAPVAPSQIDNNKHSGNKPK